VYAVQFGYAVKDTLRPDGSHALRKESLRLLGENTRADAFVLTPAASLVTLYTGRHAMALLGARDAEEFAARSAKKGLTHILFTPPDFMYVETVASRAPARQWTLYHEWANAHPEWFPMIGEVPRERASLYAITVSSSLITAFDGISAAQREFEHVRWKAGFDALDASLQTYPLVTAMKLYGGAALASGENLGAAAWWLERANKKQPLDPWPLLNLGRLAKRRGDQAAAHAFFLRALVLTEDETYASLKATIEKEMRDRL
jgi:hypothetical protein